MSVKSDKVALLSTIQFYEEYLKTVTEEVFVKTPSIGGWSYAEVYAHIISVINLSSISVEKCLNKTADVKTKKPDWRVRLILFFGKFPPGKIKVPERIAEFVKKITKEEASNQLIKVRKKIEALDVNFNSFDANFKMKHPRLGYLNAKHWLRFMVIHTRHHENQIKRIAKSFS